MTYFTFTRCLGLHLIELLITLFIIGILASISLPKYSHYLLAERRLEAEAMLSRLSVALEQYAIENNTYQTANLAALHFPVMIADGHYRLVIAALGANEYELRAEPVANQEEDKGCGTLTLNAYGEKGVTGSGKISDCW